MKKVYILIISIISFFTFGSVKAYNETYLYDEANFLSYEEKNLLASKLKEFSSTNNMDLVIVIEDTYVYNMETHADDFYDNNDFKKDGLLFLIDLSELDNIGVYVSTSGEAILYYDDDRITNLLAGVTNDLKNGNYYNASNIFIEEANNYYNAGVPESNQNCTIEEGKYVCKTPFPWSIIIIISLVVPSVVVIIFVKKNKMVEEASSANNYIKDKVKITEQTDKLTGTFTAVIPINIGNNSGRRSGGSSTHIGGGGISHGGGGRRI